MGTEERLVAIWNVVCRTYGHRSHTYVMAGDGYGHLLGRTATNEIAEFDSFDDPAFDKAREMLDEIFPLSKKTGGPLQELLGIICDPSPSGRQYSFSGRIHCPVCGRTDVDYGPDEPPEARSMRFSQVSHKNWDSLSTSQQKELLRQALVESGWIE
jgi:hypothetical protein